MQPQLLLSPVSNSPGQSHYFIDNCDVASSCWYFCLSLNTSQVLGWLRRMSLCPEPPLQVAHAQKRRLSCLQEELSHCASARCTCCWLPPQTCGTGSQLPVSTKKEVFFLETRNPRVRVSDYCLAFFFSPLSLPGHPQIFQFPGIYFPCISRNKLAVCLLEKLFALLNVPKICRDLKAFVAKFQCKTMV